MCPSVRRPSISVNWKACEVVPTPSQGRFWNYDERGGMRVPLDGEVAWLLSDGAKPYWRGHTTEIDYGFAR